MTTNLLDVRYYAPSMNCFIYVDGDKWFLFDENYNKITKTNEYYPISHMWNGQSPFCPVKYKSTLESIRNHDHIVYHDLHSYLRMFIDGVEYEGTSELKIAAIRSIKYAVDAYLEDNNENSI